MNEQRLDLEVMTNDHLVFNLGLKGLPSGNELLRRLAERDQLKAEVAELQADGREYVARTDKYLSCDPTGENLVCGHCRSCLLEANEQLKAELASTKRQLSESHSGQTLNRMFRDNEKLKTELVECRRLVKI